MTDTNFQPDVSTYSGKDYLGAESTKDWFYVDHPLPEGPGRIITELIDPTPKEWIVKASVFVGDLLIATGYADTNGKTRRDSLGKVETAAIRRALQNAGYTLKKVERAKVRRTAPAAPQAKAAMNNGDKRRVGDAPEPPAPPPPTPIAETAATRGGKPADPFSKARAAHDDDLRDKDTASRFIQRWRGQSLSDADVLAALGVSKLSEWVKGRAAADKAVNDWLAARLNDKAG